jgi:sortase (surface protein transpeptidase)
MPGQRACIAGHRGERRAGLGRDLQKVRVGGGGSRPGRVAEQ